MDVSVACFYIEDWQQRFVYSIFKKSLKSFTAFTTLSEGLAKVFRVTATSSKSLTKVSCVTATSSENLTKVSCVTATSSESLTKVSCVTAASSEGLTKGSCVTVTFHEWFMTLHSIYTFIKRFNDIGSFSNNKNKFI
jgi:hypothetical protein